MSTTGTLPRGLVADGSLRWAAMPLRRILLEMAKNGLMAIPSFAWMRKRRFSREEDPEQALALQQELHWGAYLTVLGQPAWRAKVSGAKVLEIGSGPYLGTLVRFIGMGAAEGWAIDRFNLFRTDSAVRAAYRTLMSGLPQDEQRRAAPLLSSRSAAPLAEDRVITKVVDVERAAELLPNGYFDIIVSYNVLEHVTDVRETLTGLRRLLAPNGMMLHRVDVSTHADRAEIHPLWQLSVPDWQWRLMFSKRAYPNRVRPSMFLKLGASAGLETRQYLVTDHIPSEHVRACRGRLVRRYRSATDEDIGTLDFLWVATPAGEEQGVLV